MKAIWKSGLPNYLHKLLSQHILILNEKKKNHNDSPDSLSVP